MAQASPLLMQRGEERVRLLLNRFIRHRDVYARHPVALNAWSGLAAGHAQLFTNEPAAQREEQEVGRNLWLKFEPLPNVSAQSAKRDF